MPKDTIENPLQLPAGMKQRLDEMDKDIAQAEKGMEGLKELGLDVADIEDKLEWTKKTRKVMLERFNE